MERKSDIILKFCCSFLLTFTSLKLIQSQLYLINKKIMKKHFFYTLCIALAGTVSASGQESDVINSRIKPNIQRVFKVYNNPTNDKTDQFEIQGIGGTTFTASNTSDGTAESYKHSLQIVVALTPANKTGNSNYQLIFYSPNDNMQQAATYNDGILNIYYPVAVYDDIKTKLEQAFAARKKVMVKVIQKTNGYREGTLIL